MMMAREFTQKINKKYMLKIKEGDQLPVIVGETQHQDKIDLSSFLGDQNVVLYFYPKDNTPGCSLEAREFNQLMGDFEKLQTQVIGVSTDTKVSHTSFCGKYQLNFPLIADSDLRISQLLGALGENGRTTLRITFVIDKKGAVRKIYEDVKPAGHAKEVLEFLRTSLF